MTERLPLPMTRDEMDARGWSELDILLVTGDAYVDHPSFGAALIGRALEADGWRVGIIAQPDWNTPDSLSAMGRPRLFCGVSSGNLDSMLAHYTAARHRRREDDFSPDGATGGRPNHAVVVYAQLARRAFPGLPVLLGGIEASLRRVAHYDYWEDKVRPSVLADAKADLLIYGMGEAAIRKAARRLADARSQTESVTASTPGPAAAAPDLSGIPGTARLLGGQASRELQRSRFVELPSWEEIRQDPARLLEQTRAVEAEQNPFCGRPLLQMHGERALVVEPPAPPLSTEEFDRLYALPFTRKPHPRCGRVPAYDMIRDSITVTRGCAGGCSFCGLGLHQGRFLAHRSPASVRSEIDALVEAGDFRGTITDLGGPSANLYGCSNGTSSACRSCRRASCLFPAICPQFRVDEQKLLELLRRASEHPRVRHVFTQSGIRMDVALRQPAYLQALIQRHVSGHLKIAPEHLHPDVLRRMRKPGPEVFEQFRAIFDDESAQAGKRQFLVPYFISSFPGCTQPQMAVIEHYLRQENWNLQQVQDYIPLPMTPAAAMYVSGRDYETGDPIDVVRHAGERHRQQQALRPQTPHPTRAHREGSSPRHNRRKHRGRR